jgi:hypothetical protein
MVRAIEFLCFLLLSGSAWSLVVANEGNEVGRKRRWTGEGGGGERDLVRRQEEGKKGKREGKKDGPVKVRFDERRRDLDDSDRGIGELETKGDSP